MRVQIVAAVVAFAITLLSSTRWVFADPRVVQGVVTSAESGRFVVGATVLTEHGDIAVTDNDGYFTITFDPVNAKGREITITAPGFATQTVRVPTLDDGRL